MSRRNRPSAFEVSFGEKLPEGPEKVTTLKRVAPSDSQGSSSKRNRLELPAPARYKPSPNVIEIDEESPELEIKGEDEPPDPQADDKPVRILTDFTIFDPKHRDELVSLEALEEDDGIDRHFVATGYVSAFMAEGDDDEESEEDAEDENLPFVRLGSIFRYSIDCNDSNDPVWIETQQAWYILRQPSQAYHPFFRHFYLPRRIAQLVIFYATTQTFLRFDDFLSIITTTHTILGESITEANILSSVDKIAATVSEHPESSALAHKLIIKHLVRGSRPITARKVTPRWSGHPPGSLRTHALLRNLDYFVLQSENQTTTHVTPLIAKLAGSHFGEQLVVVGAPLPSSPDVDPQSKRKARLRLQALVSSAHRIEERKYKKVIKQANRIGDRSSSWYSEIGIENDVFRVGNIALVLPDTTKSQWRHSVKPIPQLPGDIPTDATIPTYFWFAKIISLNAGDGVAHVQWLEHSMFTALEEFGNPQQLFLNNLCDNIPLQTMLGTVDVHLHPKQDLPSDHFFYSSIYDHATASVTDIPTNLQLVASHPPPHNCPSCLLRDAKDREEQISPLRNPAGFAFAGHTYHCYDHVMIKTGTDGLCDLGQIIGFQLEPDKDQLVGPLRTKQPYVKIRNIGRMRSILPHLRHVPVDYVDDEQHVYITDEQRSVPIKDLIQPCIILPRVDVERFSRLIKLSSSSFYFQYCSTSLRILSWSDLKPHTSLDHHVCKECMSRILPLQSEATSRKDLYEHFIAAQGQTPLRTLDLFSGCGAFSLGMAEATDFVKVAYAIEISPSAAKTFIRNSNVQMYNNCANIVLRYFIKSFQGHDSDAPTQLYNKSAPFPAPLKPGDVDLIMIGFPCQSHSGLNKYKKANDAKSNLILTALSYVDFLRPKYCYFENVRGFLQFNTDASQAGQHRVEGGVPMGGLKFLMQALDELGYQYQFALLQAAHYGTPQRRVRFFLVAAQHGSPLPKFPQPSYHFPVVDSLSIPLPNSVNVSPVTQAGGTLPHNYITIEDAIGDLPRFNWHLPNSPVPGSGYPSYPCNKERPWCGISGSLPTYFHIPKTAFQARCRQRPTDNIQQYTKVFLPATVKRVMAIPMHVRADHRSLPADKQEWQLSNPVSAVARRGHHGGAYGRLDKDGWFHTTVTNVNPTAKQSRILNPWCKRIVTVRELARSQGFPDDFIFEAIDNRLTTMHRHIGNAVPWPLSIALGRELSLALYERWLEDRRNAILVDEDD